MNARRYLDFGPFRIDLEDRVLLRDGKPVSLTPKAFETLRALAENHGRVVTRDDLMEMVWPDTAVEENNLTQNISFLRKVLGDSPDGGRYIETVPKRGYRFVASVTGREEPGIRQAPRAQEAGASVRGNGKEEDRAEGEAPGSRSTARRPWWRKRMVWIMPLVALLTLLTVFVAIRQRRVVAGHRVVHIRSLAVLPLLNVSRDPGQQYFADGMTDELITDLAEISSLRVVSRTSVMRYQHTREPLSQIARELHVDAVVEGTVLSTSSRVRITAQLIRASSDRHLWAKSYEASLGDAVTLQDTVAREIAGAIQAKLTPGESQRLARPRAVDPRAYQDYLMGRYFWDKRTLQSIQESIGYFDRARARDPHYAPAYAGSAASYALLGFYGVSAKTVMPKAQTLALKALSLDGSLPGAHASLGAVKAVYDWDWAGAGREFRAALKINPNYAPARHWYAVLDLAPQGRFDEAVRQMQKAEAIDPVSPIMHTDLGWIYVLAGRDGEAMEQYHQALNLDPDFLEAQDRLCQWYLLMGLGDKWAAEFEKAQLSGGRSGYAEALKRAYDEAGFKGALREAALLKSPEYDYAIYYSANGERKKAVQALENAYNRREAGLIYLKVDPLLSSLHTDPTFKALVQRMGLPR